MGQVYRKQISSCVKDVDAGATMSAMLAPSVN